ncbi:hypothetical protein ENHY17A_200095 [Moraxellaceae bacterium 17A]|nr:hypothetical protein ENHY17A_200095 [Moraxellaceae bacterium 17A]
MFKLWLSCSVFLLIGGSSVFLADRLLGDLVTLSALGLLRLGSNNKAVAAIPSLITLDMLIPHLALPWFLNLSF